ncbi:MAG: 4-hydroxy-tetrahydrodipicolinate reductase [Legionellaceae bacterium]|nr:4-hydroxy-tetrahydrodipicolinate reductase [Legionellaceae bacterium]
MNRSKVIVNGAAGKMGQLACETLEKHPDFELVARAGRQDHLAELIVQHQAAIVVDLTSAATVKANSLTIIRHNARPVIGSSGLQPEDISELQQRCQEKGLGGLIVPNFSLGAVLMMHFSSLAARLLPEAEIIEAHHPQKLDAPSGTAMKTAEMIAQARRQQPAEPPLKELVPGARGGCYQQVPIHSLRLPGVVARQSVLFGSTGETLTISHDSIDRQCFMPGVVFACQQVLQLNHLIYGLESLLLTELAR